MKLLMAMVAFSFVHIAEARTRMLEKGPPAIVEKDANDHLFQIYVTPPKATKDYSPGEVTVYLRRAYPDYINVPMKHEVMEDGRLHIQIAISPEKESTYAISVLDKQADGEILLLFWEALKSIETVHTP